MPETSLPSSIYITPSFHYDVAYLESYEAYLPRCIRILDTALAILEEHAEYRFLVEQVILLEAYWKERPEKREALKRFAGEGRLGVAPGMYVMPDMNHPDGESMFLQARIGRAWLQENLGLSPEVCWIADCWGHHAQLPQILSKSGYSYYVFWRCMRRDIQRNQFRWRGIDGTSINTHWLARGYGNVRFPSEEEVVNAPDLDLAGCGPKQIANLARTVAAHGGDMVLLCNGGDFMMPQSSAATVVKRLNAESELPRISFALPEEALKEIDWGATLKVRGEFNSAFQGTFTSNIEIKQQSRRLVNRMLSAEALAAVRGEALPSSTDIWKGILKQQFHDIICGTICDEALEDTRKEFANTDEQLTRSLKALDEDGGEPALFNSLSFSRNTVVEEEKRTTRIELPALGFAAKTDGVALPDPEPSGLPAEFETDHFRASIDEKGYVSSLIHRSSGVELVNSAGAPFGVMSMQMDYGDLWLNFESPLSGGSLESSLTQNKPDPYDRGEPGSIVNRSTFKARVKAARACRFGGERLVVEQEGEVGFWRLRVPFKTRLVLNRGSRLLEYETSIEPTGRHYRLRVAFPTAFENGRIRHEIPFGIQERDSHEHLAQNWIDYGSRDAGLALLNTGTPGNNVDDGIMLLTLFRSAAMEYKTASALSFQDGRKHCFRYAVLPHGCDEDAEIVREGLAFNRPAIECRVSQVNPNEQEWALDGESSVLLSSLRPRNDGVFIRLYEACGQAAGVCLRVPPRFKSWAPANGLEEAEGTFRAIGEGIRLTLLPFEIRGILLRPKDPE